MRRFHGLIAVCWLVAGAAHSSEDSWRDARWTRREAWGTTWIARESATDGVLLLRDDGVAGASTKVPWTGPSMLEQAATSLGWPQLVLKVTEDRICRLGRVVVLTRHIDGSPVLDQQVRVLVDAAGSVRLVRAEIRGEAIGAPDWNRQRAMGSALQAARARGAVSPKCLGVIRQGWAGTPLRPAVELVIESRQPRLSRRLVRISTHPVEVLADLETVRYASTLTGDVFDPNPIASENLPGLTDGSAIPPAAYYSYDVTANDPVAGRYRLEGPYARIAEREPPTSAPVTSASPTGFVFTRSQSGFQDFNAYFWTTTSAEYVDGLGFPLDNWPLDVDAHCDDGGSHYVPALAVLTGSATSSSICLATSDPGLGPVDHAEDADVVTHEHMHSVIDGLRGFDYSGSGEVGAIHEGSGDYWAASWGAASSAASGFDPACVGEWAAAGTLPCLRRVDSGAHYPEDLGHPAQSDEHADGEIWSQFLWDLAQRIGDFQPVDEMLLAGVLLTGPQPSFFELADAMYYADGVMHGGVNQARVQAAATARGLFPRPPEVSSATSSFPLLLWKQRTPGQYTIAWEDLGADADGYHVYEGSLSLPPYNHSAAASLCSPPFTRIGSGWNELTFTTGAGSFYYVVTAYQAGTEGPCCFIWLPGYGNVAEAGDAQNDCPP